jgi:hypothetical protein
MHRVAYLLTLVAAPALATGIARGQVLYTNNFETPSTFTVNTSGTTDSFVDPSFNYSTVGIPAAPSGAGTLGLKIYANHTSGVFGGVSASPVGQSFTGDYTLRFDWWANFNGPAPVGGSGSTQLSTFGVGTAGNTPQWPGGAQDSAWFGATGDGNSSSDWRAYSSAAPTSYLPASGVYAAGTSTTPDARNHSHPYYAGFGGVTAPAAQEALFPQQSGTTLVGSAGWEWHQVEITKSGNSITWTVDSLPIVTLDATTVILGGDNIFFGHSDTNATSSTDPNDTALLFTLIDNVEVTVVPEPGTLALVGLAVPALLRLRRRAG